MIKMIRERSKSPKPNQFKLKRQDNHQNTINDDEAKYLISGAYRKVEPYYFTYLTYCKLRWRDRTLIDIFTNEFRDREESYYKKCIKEGKVLINDNRADLTTLVKNGDLITHKIHRHEPAVSSDEIRIVAETDELIVIDKPSGIPVHPTGRYRFNTITKILKITKGLEAHPCNRLDRLTSGLMFLAKNPKGADKFVEQLKQREVSKEYIARVKGNFPDDDEVIVDKPLITIEPKLGLNIIDETNGKSAKTIFTKISFDGETSIVKCKPLTGRTHQIRVHLQYLGFPIANDPIYSNDYVWGSKLGFNGEYDITSVINNLHEIGKTKSSTSWYFPNSHGELLLNQKCDVCETELYSDPSESDLSIWLHAYRYRGLTWDFKTDFPKWALEPHVKFMELALKEADKCEETDSAFSVGALLVKDDQVLSTGYSRELPGNTHAEQCALEKYNNPLPRATCLYTTMEPCSLRLSGNKPCVDRILDNPQIRTVFVGVLEPDTFVKKNIGLEKLKEAGVEYVKIGGFEERALQIATKGHPIEPEAQ